MICDGTISGQGTVLRIDDQWAGDGHGNEVLLGTSISVNEEKKVIQDGASYSGNIIVFYRRTVIAGAYILQSTMTITHDRIDETISLQGLDETRVCDMVYAFLGSRPNRMTDYVAFNADGAILDSGQTSQNNYSWVYLYLATAVAQFDPDAGDCVLSLCTEGCDLGIENRIWDRRKDNKLYTLFYNAEGPCYLQNLYTMTQNILFFDSSPDKWQSDALSLIKSIKCSGKISGDLNNDCKVDFDDFVILAENWLDCNLEFQEACL